MDSNKSGTLDLKKNYNKRIHTTFISDESVNKVHCVQFDKYTLIYLINAQDGINEQEGNSSKRINRAGCNK